jgi:alanine dehydrogenase
MPGAVGRTSSQALCNATLPYVRELARLGWRAFAEVDAGHRWAINLAGGKLCNPGVISAFEDLPRDGR